MFRSRGGSLADLAARRALLGILKGEPPPAELVASCGEWAWLVHELAGSLRSGGVELARTTFDAVARADRRVAALLAAASAPSTPPAVCPPLPPQLAHRLQTASPCAAWLDEYIAFAAQAAPMTPRSFHQAAGLFLVSTAVARRLALPSGIGHIFPNVFVLQIAPPAVYKKTSGLNLVTALLEASGLSFLLLPQTVTPQSLMSELSLFLPPFVQAADEPARQFWLLQRTFAAQRAWLLDECAGLFEGFRRDYNSGLIELVLQLFDCRGNLTEQTQSRGLITVTRSYLSLLGATTPEAIRRHLSDRELWGKGLWSRFALVLPDSEPVYEPRPRPAPLPGSLVGGLRRIFELFPHPCAHIETPLRESDEGKSERGQPYVAVANVLPPSEAVMAEDVESLLELYSRSVGFDMLRTGKVEATFHSAYDRFGLQIYKVALLLAVMDTRELPVVVSLAHATRAIQIVESWRDSLHRLWANELEVDAVALGGRILDKLNGALGGLTKRELCQQLHINVRSAGEALELLEQGGHIESFQVGRRVLWRMVQDASVASVANCSTPGATHLPHPDAE
jgi:hypothetical protein